MFPSHDPQSDQLNALTNFVNELCATIDNVVNLGRPGSIESLLSDFDKSSLLGLVDGNIQSATALQDSEKKEALDLTSTVLQDFDDYVSGINTKELQSSLPNVKIKDNPFLSEKQKQILLDALKELSTGIPADVITAFQKFVEGDTGITQFGFGKVKVIKSKIALLLWWMGKSY